MPVRRFTRADVIEAAMVIADRDGIRGLTLRAIAASMGTGQASLYRHVANRGELLGLIADVAAAALPRAGGAGSALDRQQRGWELLYAHLCEHRWIAEAIAEGEAHSSEQAPFASDQLAAFEEMGLGPFEAERAFRALFLLTLGFVLNKHAIGHGIDTAPGHSLPHGSPGDADEYGWAVRRFLAGIVDEVTLGG